MFGLIVKIMWEKRERKEQKLVYNKNNAEKELDIYTADYINNELRTRQHKFAISYLRK